MNEILLLADWEVFPFFGIITILLSGVSAYLAWKDKKSIAIAGMVLALIVFSVFIAGMWMSQERPPMRTQGETRLFYSLFVILSGLLVYIRWGYKWIFSFSTILAGVFIITNILKPQLHSKSMMPALQSFYFVPHVISYMFFIRIAGCGAPHWHIHSLEEKRKRLSQALCDGQPRLYRSRLLDVWASPRSCLG